MLFTSHAIAGAALGATTGNPYTAILLGFISHHVLDAVPHFDQGTFYKQQTGPNYLNSRSIEHPDFKFSTRDWIVLFLDWSVSAILFAVIFVYSPANLSVAIFGALGGLLPDIIDSSPLWSKKLREKMLIVSKYHKFHEFFHWTIVKDSIFLGLATQVIVVMGTLFYLFS